MIRNCFLVGFSRKYDDTMRQQPTTRRWAGTRNRQFTAEEFTNNRIWALEAMLPRWPGFCGLEGASLIHCKLTAEEALQEFDYIVNSIKFVPIWEDNQPESKLESFRPDSFTDAVIAEVC